MFSITSHKKKANQIKPHWGTTLLLSFKKKGKSFVLDHNSLHWYLWFQMHYDFFFYFSKEFHGSFDRRCIEFLDCFG
jgi:hypothetical protein